MQETAGQLSDDNGREPSKNEALKVTGDGLIGTLFVEITDLSSGRISEDALQILEFHGTYQQDDRDQRRERRKLGLDRAWSFMVRTKHADGQLTAEQYLVADDLATKYGNYSLRITARQDFQFHGVGKANLEYLIRELSEGWMTTYGGWRDITRNTLTCPVADLPSDSHFEYQALAQRSNDRFLADSTSSSYYELSLDGEKMLADGSR